MFEAFLIIFGETVVCQLDNSCFFSTSAPSSQTTIVSEPTSAPIAPTKEITISIPQEKEKENESK